jgi:RNA polymerase sigma-70 factor (ECF subfamily)
MSTPVYRYFSNPEQIYPDDLRLHFETKAELSEDSRTKLLQDQVALLYRELQQPIFRYLLCTRLSREDAEEMVQETFFRLFRHLCKGGAEDNLRGWLFRVAHNLSSTCRHARGAILDATEEQWEQISLSISDPHLGPEELLLRKEKFARLHRGIAQLSQLQQNCILLRVEGFRYREIAEILDVTTSTVAGSLRHAIERLTREP